MLILLNILCGGLIGGLLVTHGFKLGEYPFWLILILVTFTQMTNSLLSKE